MTTPLVRLAVVGGVARDTGSGPSAYFLLLDEFLRRGVEIDFFAIKGWAIPQELVGRPGFTLIELASPLADRVMRHLLTWDWPPVRVGLGFVWNTGRTRQYAHDTAARIRRRHPTRRYTAVLALDRIGEYPRWPDLPQVSWPQGCPRAEVDPVRRLRRQVVEYAGWPFYLGFRAYYVYRVGIAHRQVRRSARVLCGSRMTADYWRRDGVPADRLVPVPFCVDLDRFRPPPTLPPRPDPFTFLHLGRIVPRKRPDLLLDGFQLYRRQNPQARLLVVGDVAIGRGYGRMFADPRRAAGVEFVGRVPRAEVPALFGRVGGLVQTSENENFGTAVMEAQACGLPVLVGPTNGTADFLAPSSVVFAGYTAEAVADGMAALAAACRRDWAGVRAAARAAAERHFAVGTVADRVLAAIAAARGN